jgi:hypothetical protein
VDAVLARHSGTTCLRDRAPTNLSTGWSGCRLQAGDTAVYFYVDPTRVVTSWQRMWKAPTSDPLLTAVVLDSLLATQFGDAQICAPDARLGHFRVWRQPGYYVALYADRDAAALRLSLRTSISGLVWARPRVRRGTWCPLRFVVRVTLAFRTAPHD